VVAASLQTAVLSKGHKEVIEAGGPLQPVLARSANRGHGGR
jgi:hypothetical protein